MYLPPKRPKPAQNNKVAYHPALLQPSVGALSNKITALTQEAVTEINWSDKKYKLSD